MSIVAVAITPSAAPSCRDGGGGGVLDRPSITTLYFSGVAAASPIVVVEVLVATPILLLAEAVLNLRGEISVIFFGGEVKMVVVVGEEMTSGIKTGLMCWTLCWCSVSCCGCGCGCCCCWRWRWWPMECGSAAGAIT